ncbi:hypothetical protein GE061_010259 [Apolygus lucorum]|uniref:Uncharacterized protein n=1 Tax=Apolygus lucorum TaxID=248454 RepID=A0A8S9Y6P0_APOLU|nr:hypothetical protein GE061_010259 [Apolygus lucorum]
MGGLRIRRLEGESVRYNFKQYPTNPARRWKDVVLGETLSQLKKNMKSGKSGRITRRRPGKKSSSRVTVYDEVEEKQNNAASLRDLTPKEKEYLRLLEWSYVHLGHRPKVKGCINLLGPLRCEETLVRIDQSDVKAVLKIMGHDWPKDQKRGNQKNRNQPKRWSTKDLDELVGLVSREEDELVSWWKGAYCRQNVWKNMNKRVEHTMKPLFFKTYDEEERLWGFAERMQAAACRPITRALRGSLTAGSKRPRNDKKRSRRSEKKKSQKKVVTFEFKSSKKKKAP